ncbi:MAG: TAXI family TRAP transporter solute-binding subunit [Sulfitobacter sp.]
MTTTLHRKFGALAASAALAATMALATPALAQDMPEETLSITTAAKGGSWFAVAASIFSKVEAANPGLVTQIQPGGGLTNIDKVQKGQSDIGLTFAFAGPLAVAGLPPFEEEYDNLTYLTALFPGHYQIIVRKDAGIEKFEDIFDKRISPGKVGFGGELMFRQMLAAYDMDYDKMREMGGVVNLLGTGDAANLMRDGNLDVILSGGNPPTHPIFSELALTTDIDVLALPDADLDKIFAANPAFSEGFMPANPYNGVAGEFRNIGGYVVVIARKDLSDEAAYSFVKSFWEGLDDLKADSRTFDESDPSIALKGNRGMPVHPGAQKYFDEVGLTN